MALMSRARRELDWPDWMFGRRPLEWPALLDLTTTESELRIEEFEDEGHLVIRAEMPGIDPDEDVEITMSDGMLHIRAERRQETKVEDKAGYRTEFRYGSFARHLTLPAGATATDVEASYADGILEVRVPVSTAEAAAKKIPITHH